MDNPDLHKVFEWLTSWRTILWVYASCVFGAYGVSLVAGLSESIGYYGPMRVFTTGGLSNMVLPFQISIYAWMLGSVLLLCGQLGGKPIHRGTVLIGAGSLAFSLMSQWIVGASLLSQKVPWFVSYLELTDTTKLLIGIVSVFAMIYVWSSPWVWRTKPKEEVAENLKSHALDEILRDIGRQLKTDLSQIRSRDVSFYVDIDSIFVRGFCDTRDGKSVFFRGRLNLPDLNLKTLFAETMTK
jgi:hypothetical protein